MTLRNSFLSKLALVAGILFCTVLAAYFPKYILIFKPLGDIFLNLIITAVVPLAFFSISSSVANFSPTQNMGKVLIVLLAIFIVTAFIAGIFSLTVLHIFPVTFDFNKLKIEMPKGSFAGSDMSRIVSVTDFNELLSTKAMLPLIIFSLLIGTAARQQKGETAAFKRFLASGCVVMKDAVKIIMQMAPIGLGIYFGSQLATVGSQWAASLAQLLLTAFGISVAYYFLAFSSYAYMAGGYKTTFRYWKNNLIPSVTALTTCSSIATLPANLEAADKMGIPSNIGNVAMPLGAIIHKEGTAIATLIGIYIITQGSAGFNGSIIALLMATLVSVIEGSIPSGGYTGIFFIVSVYHLSMEVIPLMIIISTFLDPIATLLNVTGDTSSSLIITRILRLKEVE